MSFIIIINNRAQEPITNHLLYFIVSLVSLVSLIWNSFLNFPIFCTVQIISRVKCPPGGLVWCFLTIKFRLASDYAFFLFGQKHPSVTEHPFGNYILCSFVPVTMSLTSVTCLRWGVPVFSTVKLLFLPLSLKVISVEMLWGYVNILFLLKLFLSCLGLWSRFSPARTMLS